MDARAIAAIVGADLLTTLRLAYLGLIPPHDLMHGRRRLWRTSTIDAWRAERGQGEAGPGHRKDQRRDAGR